MSNAEFETVIGLEVHVQLNTKSKIFCSCSTDYSNKPANTHVCSVCLGIPGALPTFNREVLRSAIKACLAFECQIARLTKFDRKHYFYPDLAKAYQITQFELPIGEHGRIYIAEDRAIRLNRIHIEEDAGKLLHADNAETLVDYNRSSIPLLEIVSEPDIRSAEEAKAYLEKLKLVMKYIGVSDCDMENGSLRCDVNISVREKSKAGFGVRAEVKNLNSFRSVVRAIEYENKRHIRHIKRNEPLYQETLLWDDVKGETRVMRSKGNAADYRYFPEPDLPFYDVSEALITEIQASLPELPDKKLKRLLDTYKIPKYNAKLLAEDLDLANFYEKACLEHNNYLAISNFILTELLRELNKDLISVSACKISAEHLGQLVKLVDNGTISGKIAKDVFEIMYQTGKAPDSIVKEQGLTQISDDSLIIEVINEVLKANSHSITDMQAGKMKAYGFLVGQIMKATKGKANPAKVNEILKQKLEEDYNILYS